MRVAIIPTLTDGKAGLWSTARSEGRIPMNWGALLAANGYEVYVISNAPDFPPARVPGVTFVGPNEAPEMDFVLFGTTSVLGSNWFGRSTLREKYVVRLQWPTEKQIDASGDVLAVAHPCLADQVADEARVPRESIHVLPSPTLPLAWWESAIGKPASPWPEKKLIVWAARDAFVGSQAPCGYAALDAVEKFRSLHPFVLSCEQHQGQHGAFAAMGATLTSGSHLGEVLTAMRHGVLCVTTPAFMGPTLTEAIFEDCVPLVWASYRTLFPELVRAAELHGVLCQGPDDVYPVMRRLITEPDLRNATLASYRFAFADHSPQKCIEKWKFMEGRLSTGGH